MENRPRRHAPLRVFLLVAVLVALASRLLPGQRYVLQQVTIQGFRAGVQREQIETRLGPGSPHDSGGWIWATCHFEQRSFEMLILEKRGCRWYLTGSQFELEGHRYDTQFRYADSVWQGTVQRLFGPGNWIGGESDALRYQDGSLQLSFDIDTVDQLGPDFTRMVTATTLSWPDPNE